MIRPKGLGRGLDALLSGSDDAAPANESLQTLATDRLRPGKYQPRTRMDTASLAELPLLDWEQARFTLDDLRRRLVDTRPPVVGLTRVPNARVAAALRTIAWLDGDAGPPAVGPFREALESMDAGGIDPEAIYALGDELEYAVETRVSTAGCAGTYDVVLYRRAEHGAGLRWADTPLAASATATAIAPAIFTSASRRR